MLRQPQQSMTARDICRILCRHRWRSLFFFGGVVSLAIVGVLLTPKTYLSEATFYMKPDFRVDPTATNDTQVVAFDPEREGEMRNVIALFQSRGLFEKVVDQLGTDVVFENDLKDAPLDYVLASVTSVLPSLGPKSAVVEREKAVRHLMKAVGVDHIKKSHIINVSYKSRTAERAREILEVYTTLAMDLHMEANRNPSSFEFFVEQESLLRDKLMKSKKLVRDAKNEFGLVSIDSQRKLMEEHVTNLDKELLTTATAIASAEDNIASLRARLPFEMQNPEAGNALSVHSIDTMRNQLYTLELKYRDLVSRYQAAHPQVVAAKDQLAEGRLLLNQQQLLNEISNAASLRSKRVALQRDYDLTRTKLSEINEHEVSIAEVERNAKEAAVSHQLVVTKLEQARLDQQLESEHISNLRLSQQPTVMGKSLSRRGLLIVSLALIVGTLGAVGLAYLSELLDESLGTAMDVEASLGVPVLASIPRTRLHRVSLN